MTPIPPGCPVGLPPLVDAAEASAVFPKSRHRNVYFTSPRSHIKNTQELLLPAAKQKRSFLRRRALARSTLLFDSAVCLSPADP